MIDAVSTAGSSGIALTSVDLEYRRHRRSVFAGIFAGYAAYYLVRNNLALAIPDILKEYPQHSKAELGWALTGLSISYGILQVAHGIRVGPHQSEVLPARRPAAVVRDHVRLGDGQDDLRLAGARGRLAGGQRLGAGHGLASSRQVDGPLVLDQGARARRLVVEHLAQRRRRPR